MNSSPDCLLRIIYWVHRTRGGKGDFFFQFRRMSKEGGKRVERGRKEGGKGVGCRLNGFIIEQLLFDVHCFIICFIEFSVYFYYEIPRAYDYYISHGNVKIYSLLHY
jgi:hypothetical protein